MQYGIIHREVFELRVAGELTGTASLLYEYLTFNCDVKSGIVHRLSVAQVASALRVSRFTVHRAAGRLNELALLSPDDTGNCLSGSLPHVKSAAAGRQKKSASLRDIKTPTPTEARAARHIHSPAPPPVFKPPPDARNGNEGTAGTRDVIEKLRRESGV